MGSDSLMKESNSGAQGCFWRNLKWGLAAMTSVVLVGRILLAPYVKPKTTEVHAVTTTLQPVLVRPSSTDPEYDPYFVSVAKDFAVNSDYDASSTLRKKGFRVTKDQAMQALREKAIQSATRSFLESHTDWMYANWASLGISQVPLMYAGSLTKNPDGTIHFTKQDELMSMIDAMEDHDFFMEVASVEGMARKVSGSEKYFFMYDEATWKKDGLSASKFMGFIDFFTGRAFHGAFFKELLPRRQTDMHPLQLALEDEFDDSNTQSFALMPRIHVPNALKEKCQSAAGNNITGNLGYSTICNPFLVEYAPESGPRYVIYPEGKSKFFHGEPQWKGEKECASAVDSHIKSRLAGAFAVAEAAAKSVGAPWIRVDVFLDDAAPHGAYLHRLRDSVSSSSVWDSRSIRAWAIVARGFEARSKVVASKDTTRTSEDVLKSLSCKVRTSMGKAVTCQIPAKNVMHQNSTKYQKLPAKGPKSSEQISYDGQPSMVGGSAPGAP